ncbi:MAG: OmpA family protein [Proteobacteria bacterium]|nr:OmpA family protein [Pseudomonadota bacterium]
MAGKRKTAPDAPAVNTTTLLFTALMIILLAFFIVLNAMSVRDERRYIRALGSLIGKFGILPGGVSALSNKGRGAGTMLAAPITAVEKDIIEIRGAMFDLGMEKGVNVLSAAGLRIIRIESDILFDKASIKLSPRARLFLKLAAEALRRTPARVSRQKRHPYKIIINGYTDDYPPQHWGLPPGLTNWHVSALRAMVVMRYLHESGGIALRRLSAYGYGDTRPAVPNVSSENRRRNRRVEIVLDERDVVTLEETAKYGRPRRRLGFKGFIFELFGTPSPLLRPSIVKPPAEAGPRTKPKPAARPASPGT